MQNTRARTDRARTFGLAAFFAGAALHLLLLVSLRTHWLDPFFVEAVGSFGPAGDFFGIYVAGDNLVRGESIYAPAGRSEGEPRHVPYSYFYRYLPPTACLAAIPALLLEPWPAYWLWLLLTEGMLLFMVATLRRLRSPPAPVRLALAGIALGFTPFYIEQFMGQFSLLMAVFLWGAFWPEAAPLRAGNRTGAVPPREPANDAPGEPHGRANHALREPRGPANHASREPHGPATPLERLEAPARALLRRRDLWSWSASIALKSFPALLALPLLRIRHWRRVLLGALLVIASCLPYFLVHPQDAGLFLKLNFGGMAPEPMPGGFGLANAVRALSWKLPGEWPHSLVVLGPFDTYAGNLPMVAISLLVGFVSLVVTWRMHRTRAAEIMALWVLTFFLVYEDVWEYHYVMCLPVIWLLAARGDWRWPLVWGALLALPTPFALFRGAFGGAPVLEWPAAIVALHFASKVVPVAGLYVLAARRSRTPRVATEVAAPMDRAPVDGAPADSAPVVSAAAPSGTTAAAEPGRKLRVLGLYWVASFWSLGNRMGANSFFLSPQGFARFGHEVHISIPRGPGMPAYEVDEGVQMHRYRGAINFESDPRRAVPIRLISRFFRYFYYLLIGTWNGVRVGRRVRPDVVIGYHYHGAPAAWLVGRILGIPNVTRLFGTQLNRILDHPLKRVAAFMQILALKTPASFIIMHDDGSEGDVIARRLGVPEERLKFWRDGTDHALYRPGLDLTAVRAELGIPPDHLILFCVGRFEEDKRMGRIVEILPAVVKEEPRVSLLLVGDGSERPEVEARARELGLADRLHITGALHRRELYKYFNLGDIFIGVSDRTNANHPPIEAMVCAKPVVVLNTGGTRTLIEDGVTGILIDPASWPEDLPRAVVALLRDPERRRRLGEAAREKILREIPTYEERQRMEVEMAVRAVEAHRARKRRREGTRQERPAR